MNCESEKTIFEKKIINEGYAAVLSKGLKALGIGVGITAIGIAALMHQLPFAEKIHAQDREIRNPDPPKPEYNLPAGMPSQEQFPTYLNLSTAKVVNKVLGVEILPEDAGRTFPILYPSNWEVKVADLLPTTLYTGTDGISRLVGVTGDAASCTDYVTCAIWGALSLNSQPFDSKMLDQGITLEGFAGGLQKQIEDYNFTRNLVPTSVFTVRGELYATYMNAIETSGNDHHINYAAIVKYNPRTGKYEMHNFAVNHWPGEENGVRSPVGNMLGIEVGDEVYFLATQSGRFKGGVVFKTTADEFASGTGATRYKYYLGNGVWSDPTQDWRASRQAAKVIPDRCPDLNVEDYDALPLSQQKECETIGEFSVIRTPWGYMLFAARTFGIDDGLYVYFSPDLLSWSLPAHITIDPGGTKPEQWPVIYAPFTNNALIEDLGNQKRRIGINISRWPVGVYQLAVDVSQKNPPPGKYNLFFPFVKN